MKTFEQAWSEQKAQGYDYGYEALENVRFGWELALSAIRALPTKEPEGSLSIKETQELLGSEVPIPVGKITFDPLGGMRIPVPTEPATQQVPAQPQSGAPSQAQRPEPAALADLMAQPSQDMWHTPNVTEQNADPGQESGKGPDRESGDKSAPDTAPRRPIKIVDAIPRGWQDAAPGKYTPCAPLGSEPEDEFAAPNAARLSSGRATSYEAAQFAKDAASYDEDTIKARDRPGVAPGMPEGTPIEELSAMPLAGQVGTLITDMQLLHAYALSAHERAEQMEKELAEALLNKSKALGKLSLAKFDLERAQSTERRLRELEKPEHDKN